MTPWLYCECGWAGHSDELDERVIFFATIIDPAEYVPTCPVCGRDAQDCAFEVEPRPCPGCGERWPVDELERDEIEEYVLDPKWLCPDCRKGVNHEAMEDRRAEDERERD